MPELPEVETIRQDLRKKILNKKIVGVEVYVNKSVGGEKKKFVKVLEGNEIKEIDRRGKLMIFRLKKQSVIPSEQSESRNRLTSVSQKSRDSSISLRSSRNDKTKWAFVLIHLKMTGQLIYEKKVKNKIEIVAGGHKMSEKDIDALPNKWTRVAFVFEDGGELFFNDLRLFGYMKLANEEEVAKALEKFGPEPIVIPAEAGIQDAGSRVKHGMTFAYFSTLFKKRKNTSVKAMLLNQELIAGLGNIYVDEVCFCAGVQPSRRVGSVKIDEQKKIFDCIPKILKEAIHHRGTTFRNFLDSSGKKGNYTDFLRVYDRTGKPCKKCGGPIKKIRAAGRGTHFCPVCQK